MFLFTKVRLASGKVAVSVETLLVYSFSVLQAVDQNLPHLSCTLSGK